MRIYALAIAMALVAQPAWAHHKPTHPDFPRTPAAERVVGNPCAVSRNPHQLPGARAMADRCRRLLADLRAAPNDGVLRERCNRTTRALTGGTCDALLEARN